MYTLSNSSTNNNNDKSGSSGIGRKTTKPYIKELPYSPLPSP